MPWEHWATVSGWKRRQKDETLKLGTQNTDANGHDTSQEGGEIEAQVPVPEVEVVAVDTGVSDQYINTLSHERKSGSLMHMS